jgi:hypothetical protein
MSVKRSNECRGGESVERKTVEVVANDVSIGSSRRISPRLLKSAPSSP